MLRTMLFATATLLIGSVAQAQQPQPTGDILQDCRDEMARHCNIRGNMDLVKECLEKRVPAFSPACTVTMNRMGWRKSK